MCSTLSNQQSPYLLQHAQQPVKWMTWSKGAFDKAASEDKPVLISIGYAACHWCQEMSRNCFDDPYIASLMNRHFIPILVDREERPDLDNLYMEAVQMFNQSAGWPLNLFCLPDGRPFWGGTYFPKEDLGNGLAPWPQILMRISEHYRKAKHELVENAENVVANLSHANHADCSSNESWSNHLLLDAAERLCHLHDDQFGGFTPAPKFPSPMKIDFLLSMTQTNHIRTIPNTLQKINNCISTTLSMIAKGGLYDHVGGGFFRYSTDEKWTQPHYEKMLSDNALLLSTYSRAYRHNQDHHYNRVIKDTISWLNREMGSSSTGYASSLSAESNGIEGAYYEWSKQELIETLGMEVGESFFEALPTSTLGDKNKLPQLLDHQLFPHESQLEWFNLLNTGKKGKSKPLQDTKRLISHNSLVVSALIDASIALHDTSILGEALNLEKWISSEFLKNDTELRSYIYPGISKNSHGNLDDYCFYTQALLDLSKVSNVLHLGSSEEYIQKAIKVIEQTILKFKDPQMTGFFFTEEKLSPPPPCRKKVWYDNATPAGNSALLRIFSQLYHLTEEEKWKIEFNRGITAYPQLTQKVPEGVCHALNAISEDAVGIISLITPKNQYDEIYRQLLDSPPRQIFLNPRNKLIPSFEMRVGSPSKEIKSDGIENLFDFLKK